VAKTKNKDVKIQNKILFVWDTFLSIVKRRDLHISLFITIIAFIPLALRILSTQYYSFTFTILLLLFYFISFGLLIYLSVDDVLTLTIRSVVAYFGLLFLTIVNLVVLFVFNQELVLVFQNAYWVPSTSLIAGALMGFLIWIITKITKEKGMGEGDIYVYAIAGLLLGTDKIIPAFYITIFSALLVGIILAITRKKLKGVLIPFVPFITLGTIASLSFAPELMEIQRLIFPFLFI